MAVDLTNKIHGDFSTGSGVWMGYRSDITGEYITGEGTGANYVIYSNKLIREYNEKISELNQPSNLYIEPYDAGFRYTNDPLLATYTGAIGAYSTRTIGFGGPLMRIRRSSDNTEVDVRGDGNGDISLSSPIIDYRENLVTYSEDFSEWQTSPTISSSSETDPNGGLTASTVVGRTISATVTALNGGNTISIYAKKGTTDFLVIRTQNWDASARTWFDLTNGTVGTVGHDSAAISSEGNGWYRCSVVFSTSSDLNGNPEFVGVDSNGSSTVSTDNINIWGAQFNKGSTLEKYIKTEASAITELDRPQESLGVFMGATHTGRCSVWYDQTTTGSNRINAVQTTASLQPILVDGGELVTSNNDKAALKFLGHTTMLSLEDGFNASGDFYFVHETDDTEVGWAYPIGLADGAPWVVDYGPWCSSGEDGTPYKDYAGDAFKVYGNDNLISTGVEPLRAFFSGLSGKMLGSHINATTNGWYTWNFGRGFSLAPTTLDFSGTTQEWIFYPSGSAQTGIQNNINNHFKIY